MKQLKEFFWLCSGAHADFLLKSPSEASKYVGIGATIFFTGVFAALAGGFALFLVFDAWWIATLLGLLWGLLIFNLDRYIVSSMRKEGRPKREWAMAAPRLILAIIISLVIAKPLEMKIFEKEIQTELTLMSQEVFMQQDSLVNSRFNPLNVQQSAEIETLKKEISNKTAERNKLQALATEEADGTGGTMQRNAGPIYKIKKENADKAERELAALVAANSIIIDKSLANIQANDSLKAVELNGLVRSAMDGPAARMEALSRLMTKSAAIWWANWFVVLLFIALETAPVLVKLISPRGPYDQLLKVEEYGFEAQRIEGQARINTETKARTEGYPNTEKEFVTDRLDARLKSS